MSRPHDWGPGKRLDGGASNSPLDAIIRGSGTNPPAAASGVDVQQLTDSLSGRRAVHFSYREVPPDYTGLVSLASPSSCEVVVEPTGTSTIGCRIARDQPSSRIATMVAGNSGRPGGAVGVPGGVDAAAIHAHHRTQEEDLVSNWLLTESAGGGDEAMGALFQATCGGQWGMCEPEGHTYRTVQHVDYVRGGGDGRDTSLARMFADAWVVPGCTLSATTTSVLGGRRFDREAGTYETTLVFAAGPNAHAASQKAQPSSTMRRTYCAAARDSYPFFREGVKWALRASLDAAARQGCTVALLAAVSCGLYAGPHKERIGAALPKIVDELLVEPVPPHHLPRGLYFERVVVTRLGETDTVGATLPPRQPPQEAGQASHEEWAARSPLE